jgi:hypothetical protein
VHGPAHCHLVDVAVTTCARMSLSVPTTSGGRSPRSRFPGGTLQRGLNIVSSTLTSALRRSLTHLRFDRPMIAIVLRFEG